MIVCQLCFRAPQAPASKDNVRWAKRRKESRRERETKRVRDSKRKRNRESGKREREKNNHSEFIAEAYSQRIGQVQKAHALKDVKLLLLV